MSRESRHMDETSEVTRYITERDTSSEQSIPTPKVKKSQSRNYSKHDFESVEEEVITCICANILSRINEASTDKYSPVKQYSLFDRGITRGKLECTLDNIKHVFSIIYQETEMEYPCMVISLIYMERMVERTKLRFRICDKNWQCTLFMCMMLSSKIWDDFSMINADYATLFAGFSLESINSLEMELLDILDFNVEVSSSEYLKLHGTIQELICASKLLETQLRLEQLGAERDIADIWGSGVDSTKSCGEATPKLYGFPVDTSNPRSGATTIAPVFSEESVMPGASLLRSHDSSVSSHSLLDWEENEEKEVAVTHRRLLTSTSGPAFSSFNENGTINTISPVSSIQCHSSDVCNISGVGDKRIRRFIERFTGSLSSGMRSALVSLFPLSLSFRLSSQNTKVHPTLSGERTASAEHSFLRYETT
eukprot:CAMPEP_0185028886 /NCGR_PEP_ID=MMETSP1103-20130426/14953_1 /TAXON_ID=36769 /ORGANISM="Paraphysomonas bandaiensis, Strain Caron Lab Isolate" /LENGTH=422 /DNA_ID=CAMNT_0027563453 /DNA_START=79 /DNA_END=1347 /DNA_ORIENTATION=+